MSLSTTTRDKCSDEIGPGIDEGGSVGSGFPAVGCTGIDDLSQGSAHEVESGLRWVDGKVVSTYIFLGESWLDRAEIRASPRNFEN